MSDEHLSIPIPRATVIEAITHSICRVDNRYSNTNTLDAVVRAAIPQAMPTLENLIKRELAAALAEPSFAESVRLAIQSACLAAVTEVASKVAKTRAKHAAEATLFRGAIEK